MPDGPQIGWIIPFLAGIVSFLSPCVLPLVPGYLSYVSGVSAAEMQSFGTSRPGRVLGQSLLFVLGFATVFVALGASASAIGATLLQYRPLLNKVSGLFIIAMGLYLLGILRRGWLAREYKLAMPDQPGSPVGATVLGAAFAFAWTPCIGPILATILLYAGSVATVKAGAIMLFVYALGLGVPFVLTGIAFSRVTRALQWFWRFARPLEALSGLTLLAVGALLLTNKMFYVAIWGQRLFTRLGLELWRYF